jgi:hypothetical protein
MSTADSGELDLAETTARYLADQLDAADASAFEARVAAEPRLYRDIDFSLRLKEGLATLQDRGELASLMKPDRRRVFAAAAIAAAIALLVGVVWLSRTASHAGAVTLARAGEALLDDAGKPLPTTGRVMLVRTRGDLGAREVTLPAARASIELLLEPPSIEGRPQYHIFLKRQDGGAIDAKVGELGSVAVDASGYVDVFVDSSTLKPGMYAIALRTEGGGESPIPAAEVAFVVVPSR